MGRADLAAGAATHLPLGRFVGLGVTNADGEGDGRARAGRCAVGDLAAGAVLSALRRRRRESGAAGRHGAAAHLDRIDAFIEEGTIGGTELNAADFQIATSTRVVMNFPQLRRRRGRPAAEHAMRIVPDFGREMPVRLPEDWLP